MNITLFGAGYVGLVTAACFADVGHHVLCIDVDSNKIDKLNKGKIPIYEPGLEQMISQNRAEGRIRFSTDMAQAVYFGDLLFIAVGTPSDEDGSADLHHVLDVAAHIGQYIDNYKIIINKSTVPVGTAEKVQAVIRSQLLAREVDIPFDVCSNPEFLKEGSAIEDFTRSPRIIIGTASEIVRQKMRECYAPYNRNHNKILFMDVRAAELTKYAANAMLATRISFMNEMANLADHLGVDIEQVRQGIGSDPRIGYDFIYSGCGYGGSCFPKDVRALTQIAHSVGYNAHMLHATETVNIQQKNILLYKLNKALNNQLAGKTIAVWGLSYKPDTDDMREAPSRVLMEALWEAGAIVRAYDPVAMTEAKKLYPDQPLLILVNNRDEAVEGADALVICTEWKLFRTVDFKWLANKLRKKVIIDGRNLYEPTRARQAGLSYFGIGRS